ncbi:unnamed protein product [Plutella xylostella]|uniref:(diamondback moth) hypothetical protein n=1 Tax=Plutella xylostella TaxID=51655 RepID=A0A8S4CVY0_PLUXY|nr:unnamed protein product [Plutella xylostella]
MKTAFPLTRGFLKRLSKIEDPPERAAPATAGARRRGRRGARGVGGAGAGGGFACRRCQCKRYKYRRNLLRHELYECGSGPQFCCERCGRRYSQNKTLQAHLALKHASPASAPGT